MSATSSNILKGMFFCTVGLNSRLKMFRKPRCKQLCCHPGFVVPFIEHRRSRFSVILQGPRIFRMVNERCLHLRSRAALATESQPAPEALTLGADPSSLATTVLGGILFH